MSNLTSPKSFLFIKIPMITIKTKKKTIYVSLIFIRHSVLNNIDKTFFSIRYNHLMTIRLESW